MKKVKKEKCSNLLKNEFWVFPPEYSVLLFTIIALCREQQEENSTAGEFKFLKKYNCILNRPTG
jgi:hypothetical protein